MKVYVLTYGELDVLAILTTEEKAKDALLKYVKKHPDEGQWVTYFTWPVDEFLIDAGIEGKF